MALKVKTLDLNCGIRLSDVYFRIKSVAYDCTNEMINYLGDFYISEKTRQLGENYAIGGYYISGHCKATPEMKGQNLFSIAYNNIKEKAEKLRGQTYQQIVEENSKAFNENRDDEIIDPLYIFFLDCEDILEEE